ncbi:unnamed protein product, partial [Durusdinium trenchii]
MCFWKVWDTCTLVSCEKIRFYRHLVQMHSMVQLQGWPYPRLFPEPEPSRTTKRTCYALRGHQTTPRVWEEVAFGLGSPMPEQGGIFRAAISLDVTSQALPSAEAAASSQQSERGFVQELSTAAPNSDRWREK